MNPIRPSRMTEGYVNTEFWASKYALSTGSVEKMFGVRIGVGLMFQVPGKHGWLKLGRDLHTTRDEALAAAEKLRLKTIAMHERQLARLKNLSFIKES